MKLLLLGAQGQLGRALFPALEPLGLITPLARQECDLENLDKLGRCVRRHAPDMIINAAAYTAVDQAEVDVDRAYQVNALAPARLAEEAERLGARFIHFSTDYVFGNQQDRPRLETDQPGPLNVYGETKLQGEAQVQAIGGDFLILRTSWVYGAQRNNFAKTILKLALEREQLRIVSDQIGAPTDTGLIADVTARLIEHRPQAPSGIYHLAAAGETSWHGFACHLIEEAKRLRPDLNWRVEEILAVRTEDYEMPAQRPKNSRLDTAKLCTILGFELPTWQYRASAQVAEILEQISHERS